MTEILSLFASISLVALAAIAGWMLTENVKQRLVRRWKGRRR